MIVIGQDESDAWGLSILRIFPKETKYLLTLYILRTAIMHLSMESCSSRQFCDSNSAPTLILKINADKLFLFYRENLDGHFCK